MQDGSLRRSVISGLRWSASMRLLVQGLTWAVTIKVVQLVTPEQYGLAAIAGVVAGYLNLLNEFGLSVVLVQKRVEDEGVLRCVFGFLLMTGTGFALALAGAASPIARFFHSPQVAPLVRIMALQLVAMAFCVIPQATLSRHLNFKQLSTIGFITNASGSFCTLTLAYLGLGAKALVLGAVTISITRALALNCVSPFLRLPHFQFRKLRGLFSTSSLIVIDRSLWYFSTAADNVVVGKWLGATALGAYSLALNVASIPMERALEIINSVALPAYSSVQGDLGRVANGYLKSLRLSAALSFPTFWGIALVAPTLFGLLFGSKWAATIPIIQIICVAMPARSLGPLAPPVLMGIGRTASAVKITLWAAVIAPACILIGVRWGLPGVAIAWCVAFPLVFVIGTLYVTRSLRISYTEIGRALVAPAAAGFAMAAAVSASHLIAREAPASIRLPVDIALGAAVYLLVLRLSYRTRFEELREIVLSMFARQAHPTG